MRTGPRLVGVRDLRVGHGDHAARHRQLRADRAPLAALRGKVRTVRMHGVVNARRRSPC